MLENGYEAILVIEDHNEFKDASPRILLAAYVAALTPSGLEARMPSGQFGEGLPDVPKKTDDAEGPGVCLIFSEFCQCAACLVLDRRGECGQCPEL